MRTVALTVRLGAPADLVWARATTLRGVNHELRPLIRMTAPPALRGGSIAELEVGRPAGRSWLLLAGLIPVDYDDLCLAEIEPPRRFLERSEMATMSAWQHERVIEPEAGASCSLTDTLRFELRRPLRRIQGAEALAERTVRALFAHRHRRLAGAWGTGRR